MRGSLDELQEERCEGAYGAPIRQPGNQQLLPNMTH